MIGISVRSDLIVKDQIKVFFDFPYPDSRDMAGYVGSYDNPGKHSSVIERNNSNSVSICRIMDGTDDFILR